MTTLIQNEQKRQKIMARMREHLVPVLEHCRGGWVGLFLQGSQNYNLDYEGSDIDTKAIMLPSFSDFVLNAKPLSTTHIMENNEHVDFKDIRLMFDCIKKQNVNFVEILFTPYSIINPEYPYSLGGDEITMAKKNDSLGDRMKGYEGVSRNFLTRRVPAIIRLDGKAFHTFTKGMEKPFDLVLTQAMQETMKHLCENIQGCVLGYTQSDEITLVLTDYATIQTDAWFGYNIQKMCSVSASMATMAFNREFERIAEDWFHDNGPYWKSIGVDVDVDLTIYKRYNAYQKKMFTAMFDSRVFSVPKEEVCNCLIWRQQDATRNSIEAVGQANFSHHELHKKTCNMIQEMLWSQRGINWNDFLTELKRGSCCIKRQFEETIDDPRNPDQKITVCRNRWIIDHEIPIFTQDREYIERLI